MTPRRRQCATPLAWLFAALSLLCFAPANAIAQTPVLGTDNIDLGTESGVRLKLIFPKTTADGKTYYYVDVDEDDAISIDDDLNHNLLDALFNGGTDTTVTQEGAHDGTDDARSALIGAYTLILPTEAELLAFIADPSYGTLPDGARNGAAFSWTADLTSAGNHQAVVPSDGSSLSLIDTSTNATVLFFQVLPLPAAPTFGTATIPHQIYPRDTRIDFTLPTASGGISPLIYTMTRTGTATDLVPSGMALALGPPTIISGTPSVPFGGTPIAELVYTVTDTRPGTATAGTASLTFTLQTVSVTVDTTAGETVDYLDGALAALNIGGGTGGNNNNDMRLLLPPISSAAPVLTVTAYDPSADTAPPAPDGVTFSDKAMDIALTVGSLTAGTTATVCLSTAGVPGGSSAVYRYDTTTTAWEETSPPARTIPGFVCGATDTFSPFAVGYNQIAARLSAVSQTILPEVARAITDTTVNAITQRLEQAGADSHQPGAFTLAGQSTLADILTTGGQSLAAGTLNLHDVLGRSAFVLPLTTGGDLAKNLTLWGGGDYREIGGSGGAVDWDGALFSARLGADARVSDTLLAGAALSWTDGDFEYGALAGEPTSGGGDYTLEMTSIAPYVGWSVLPGGRLNLWATAGYGWGEVAITDAVAQNAETIEDTQTSEATLKLAGGGVSARILDSGMGHVRLKGEIMQTSMELEGRDFIEALTVEARRARFSVAAGRTYTSADGARLTPTVEVGLRHDAGDGRTGTGAEVGGELSYTDPYNWLTLDTQGRVLLGHNGGYDDWGIGAIFTLKPTPGGQGLALRLTPTYGQTVTNTAQLWDQNAAALTGTDAAALGQRMNAEVGYGLAMADGQSLLTPYGNMTWGQRTRAYRLGSRLTLASGLNLSLESRRGETPGVAVEHGVLVNVEWGW